MRGLKSLLAKYRGDTIWALLDQASALLSSTLSFLLLGRTLGAAGYGAYIGLYALIGPFLAPSLSGILLAAMEHVVRDREDPVVVARSSLGITIASTLLWVPVLSAVALRWIDGLPPMVAVVFVSTEFLLSGLLSASIGMVQALIGFTAAVRLRIAGALARVVLLIVLAAAGMLTLTTLAFGQVFTVGAVAAYGIAKVSRLIGVPARPGRIHLRHVRSVLLYGVGIAASNAQTDGDKFVLSASHHQADTGRYGAAYRLLGVVQLPVNALAGATHLSFLYTQEGPNLQMRRAVRLALVATAYAVPAIICMVVLAPLVPKILTRDFGETTLILQLLSPVVILRGTGVFPMNGLMGLGRNALRTKLQVGNALLSLALYAALIPKYSWRGALVATLISEVTLCGSAWIALLLCERGLRPRASAERETGEVASQAANQQLAATAVRPGS